MKLKSEMGVAKQIFVSKLRKMHVVFVSKTRNLPTEAVAATAASVIFRFLISTISPNLKKSCKLKLLGSFSCDEIQLSIILVSVPV